MMPRARRDCRLIRPTALAGLKVLTALVMLTGCVQVPELDRAVPDWVASADYPDLVPIGPEIAIRVPPQEQASQISDELTARRDRLARRARRLRVPVLDDATRIRMAAGVPR